MKLSTRFTILILRWLTHYCASRAPDLVVGADKPQPYLRRWWVLPRNRVFNIYLHEFLRSDDDRALHDHPWLFNASIILRGTYREHSIAAGGIHRVRERGVGAMKFRWGAAPHRIELLGGDSPQPTWTLFITGPVVRHWGFHCPKTGWVPWARFTANDGTTVGRGCDQ